MKTETASAVIARPSVRFEHLVGAVTLVERRLAAEPEGGIALLDRGLAVAGAREALVGIGVARGAIAVGVAMVVDGEGVRCGHCQKRQAKGGDQHGQAMTGRRRRQMLHDGLMHVRSGKAARTIWLHGGECKSPRLGPARRKPGQERAHRLHHVSWPRFLWTPHCSMEPRRKEAHE